MRYLIGVFLIIVSAISFGAGPIFARLTYESGTTSTTLLFLRFGVASLCMILMMLARGIPLPRGRTLLGLVLMGALGYAGQSFCYYEALALVPAGLVALLLYLYPAIVTVLAVLILRERISKLKILALLLALGGAAFTIGPTGDGNLAGIALGLGAAFIYSFYIIAGSKIVKQGAAIQSSGIIITSAALVYGVIIAIKGASFPGALSGWVWAGAFAVISTVLAIVTFLAGLERTGATHAATLSTIEPVVTVILATIVLDERITPLRMAGGLLIMLAVIILARSGLPAKATEP
jgi:drug/metabolite transporter (DMT)-like permease